jgi:hypothetical protein
MELWNCARPFEVKYNTMVVVVLDHGMVSFLLSERNIYKMCVQMERNELVEHEEDRVVEGNYDIEKYKP